MVAALWMVADLCSGRALHAEGAVHAFSVRAHGACVREAAALRLIYSAEIGDAQTLCEYGLGPRHRTQEHAHLSCSSTASRLRTTFLLL